jgi:hypothetical protein
MRGAIPPLIKYAFMAWCLVKHRETLPLPLLYLSDRRLFTDIKHRLNPGKWYGKA